MIHITLNNGLQMPIVRKERMVENLAVFDFEMNHEDMARIATLETGQSAFFSQRDPAIVKWVAERKLEI